MSKKVFRPIPHAGVDLHRAVGGTETWRRLSVAFYSRVGRDPLLRPFFPGKNHRCAIEQLTAFLAQLFGGPSDDTQSRWWLSLRESHQRFKIRQEERVAWTETMAAALDDAQIEEHLRSALGEFFERSSAHVVNTGNPAPARPDRVGPPSDSVGQEMARRWEDQCKLDETVAAVRLGDADQAIAFADSLQHRFRESRSVFAGLLALMMGSRNPKMLRYVQGRIIDDLTLTHERYAGRTLLHEASAQCNPEMVDFLLRRGADANAKDAGRHHPLYCLANEYRGSAGGAVVRALVQGGADVSANGGVKHCTALHMAARRGNVEIAGALLDCGAEIDARDCLGDTPLRRAVNCNKIQVAALLLKRSADVHSIGNQGLTPLLAARTPAMKKLLLSNPHNYVSS